MSDLYGPIVDGELIETKMIAHLKLWIPDYLAEVERQREVPPESLPGPKSYSQVNEWRKSPEDRLPAVLVLCPGLARPPRREGDGRYTATWAVGVGVVSAGRNVQEVKRNSKLYTAAIRALVLQHPGLPDLDVLGATWEDERYDNIREEKTRTIGSGQVMFGLQVRDVTNTNLGTATPQAEPYEEENMPVITDSAATVGVES